MERTYPKRLPGLPKQFQVRLTLPSPPRTGLSAASTGLHLHFLTKRAFAISPLQKTYQDQIHLSFSRASPQNASLTSSSVAKASTMISTLKTINPTSSSLFSRLAVKVPPLAIISPAAGGRKSSLPTIRARAPYRS
ncbi:hypothetical protein KSP40_PGU003981 [Platanthera guangdongensis]|uniref:Uncharacterized protein n=1 Tax=Platanthera guangdongensis TaxID=2320717 RepID=A0ABR2LR42_9ASPA